MFKTFLDKAGVVVDGEQQPAVEARIKCAKAFSLIVTRSL